MKELIGHTIKEIHVNEDQSIIRFTDAEGHMIYYCTEADCCSETWFADILMSGALFNAEVTEVVELEVPEWVNKLASSDGRTRQEYDLVYGYQIKASSTKEACYTNRAQWCDIIFRNSSNGYYCGCCEVMDVSTEWSQKKLGASEWEQIKQDWRA